jgi:phosphoserine phosphatase
MSERPTAAFFDLDRTLIAGSSAFVFARAARDAGYIRLQDFVPDVLRALKFQFLGSSANQQLVFVTAFWRAWAA